MSKSILVRAAGLMLAVVAFPLAAVALLTNFRLPFLVIHFRGPFWGWIASWMPPVRYDIDSMSIVSSLPGFIAACLVGLGVGIAVFPSRKPAKASWEDDGS